MPDLTFKLILTTTDANVKLAEVKQEAESTQSVVEIYTLTENFKFHHQSFKCPSPKDDEPDELDVLYMLTSFRSFYCVYRTGFGKTIGNVQVLQ